MKGGITAKLRSRKFLIGFISFLFLILFIFLGIDGYLNLERDQEINIANSRDMINQRTSSVISEMNIFPQNIDEGVIFLSRLSSLNQVIDSTNESKEKYLKILESDFLNYIKESNAHYQLSYIDETGQEISKAGFNGTEYYIGSKDELQNEKEDHCFIETIKLDKGELYVSGLELDSQAGIMREDMNVNRFVSFPIIRIATPVFGNQGNKKGVIVLSIYMDYFLEDIRMAQREGEVTFLIDKEGYYLAHPDKEKEFSFKFNKNYKFYTDYPEISETFLAKGDNRRFEKDNLVFSFSYIHPIVGSTRIFGLDGNYSWILVTVSDKSELDITLKRLKTDYLYFLLFSGVVILVIMGVVVFAVFWGHKLDRELGK